MADLTIAKVIVEEVKHSYCKWIKITVTFISHSASLRKGSSV